MSPAQVPGTRYNFAKATRKLPKSAAATWTPAASVRPVGSKAKVCADTSNKTGVRSGTEPGDTVEDDFVHAGAESEDEDYVWVTG